MTEKMCCNCGHSMQAEPEIVDQVYCIESPPIPVFIGSGVVSFFPRLMKWGKCDKFEAGKTQPTSLPKSVSSSDKPARRSRK